METIMKFKDYIKPTNEGKFDNKDVGGWRIIAQDDNMGGLTTATYYDNKLDETAILGILGFNSWKEGSFFFVDIDDDENVFKTLKEAVSFLKKRGFTIPNAAQEALLYEYSILISNGFRG